MTIIERYYNHETGLCAEVFVTENSYRMRLVDTDCGEVLPTIRAFPTLDLACTYAKRCVGPNVILPMPRWRAANGEETEMTTFRVVQLGCAGLVVKTFEGEGDLFAWLKECGFRSTRRHANPRTRAELQGQPIIDGFCGPMWDGGAIRYEDQSSYDTLSR